MSGLRRQAAALPPQPSNLTLCAHAYAVGDTARGDRLFHAAFLDVMPLVRAVVVRHVDGPEDREDAAQQAMTNIWRAAQRGIDPAIELYARGAAIDRFRREIRHDRRRKDETQAPTTGSGQRREDESGYAGDDDWYWREVAADDDHANATLDGIETERIAARLGEERPIWADIVRCLAFGLTQAETARALGKPAGTITRNVVEIRTYIEARRAA